MFNLHRAYFCKVCFFGFMIKKKFPTKAVDRLPTTGPMPLIESRSKFASVLLRVDYRRFFSFFSFLPPFLFVPSCRSKVQFFPLPSSSSPPPQTHSPVGRCNQDPLWVSTLKFILKKGEREREGIEKKKKKEGGNQRKKVNYCH
eukprot:TRINITY_DN150_c4_g1_i1.p1 TRINITY_DN150_c4_g1~~TRINITY_DN150_c4_g1_i1.p1  ORF type:complete len:144 (+),score=6.34 TRINITY_DN150_c4_g1_i1:406-837(+)